VATAGGRAFTLDDEVVRATAQADPVGCVSQYPDGLLAILPDGQQLRAVESGR
jgi:hypothetical protein